LIFQFFITSVVLRWLWKYSEGKSGSEAVHRKN
jgi:preprotein translocase subunit SecG